MGVITEAWLQQTASQGVATINCHPDPISVPARHCETPTPGPTPPPPTPPALTHMTSYPYMAP